jgi:hypothetical protein
LQFLLHFPLLIFFYPQLFHSFLLFLKFFISIFASLLALFSLDHLIPIIPLDDKSTLLFLLFQEFLVSVNFSLLAFNFLLHFSSIMMLDNPHLRLQIFIYFLLIIIKIVLKFLFKMLLFLLLFFSLFFFLFFFLNFILPMLWTRLAFLSLDHLIPIIPLDDKSTLLFLLFQEFLVSVNFSLLAFHFFHCLLSVMVLNNFSIVI